MSDETRRGERPQGESRNASLMQGTSPGRRICDVSVLDLRDVPADEVAHIEELDNVSVILLDNDNRTQIRNANMNNIGTVVIVDATERVHVVPQLDLSRTSVEAMSNGQRLLIVGNLFFRPDVSPALGMEKFSEIRLVGTLIICEGLYGALLSKLQIVNGLTLLLPDDVGPITRIAGETSLTAEYLSRLPDDTTFLNLGEITIAAEIVPDMLQQKVRAYYNAGETTGPSRLLAVLQARCMSNDGSFHVTDI